MKKSIKVITGALLIATMMTTTVPTKTMAAEKHITTIESTKCEERTGDIAPRRKKTVTKNLSNMKVTYPRIRKGVDRKIPIKDIKFDNSLERHYDRRTK